MRPSSRGKWIHPSPVLGVILGDFGREAALGFALSLAREERCLLADRLPPNVPFLDEYRRITLSLVGDLPWAKREALEPYRRDSALLDVGVLVGFSGGVPLEDLEAPMTLLTLEALAGAVRRGCQDVWVLLPCNTLAPLSWRLQEIFGHLSLLEEILEFLDRTREWEGLLPLLEEVMFHFPTVPEVVMEHLSSGDPIKILPLGTLEIGEIYSKAAREHGGPVEVVALDQEDRDIVLEAIQDSLASPCEPSPRLMDVLRRTREAHGEDLIVVEACTDLELSVGHSSREIYSRGIVEQIYSR